MAVKYIHCLLICIPLTNFYGKTFSPKEAKAWITEQSDQSITEPQTFEEQAMKFVGKDLYQAFF